MGGKSLKYYGGDCKENGYSYIIDKTEKSVFILWSSEVKSQSGVLLYSNTVHLVPLQLI